MNAGYAGSFQHLSCSLACPRPLPELDHCQCLWRQPSHLYWLANVHQVTRCAQGRQPSMPPPSLEEIMSGLRSLRSHHSYIHTLDVIHKSWGKRAEEAVHHLKMLPEIFWSLKL